MFFHSCSAVLQESLRPIQLLQKFRAVWTVWCGTHFQNCPCGKKAAESPDRLLEAVPASDVAPEVNCAQSMFVCAQPPGRSGPFPSSSIFPVVAQNKNITPDWALLKSLRAPQFRAAACIKMILWPITCFFASWCALKHPLYN